MWVEHHFKGEKTGTAVHLTLAAVQDSAEAKRLFDYITIMTSVGSKVSAHSLGDEIRIWGAQGKLDGPLIYRFRNVFMEVSFDNSPEEPIEFARKFDALLKKGSSLFKFSKSLTMPQVELIDPPASVTRGEVTNIRLRISPIEPEKVFISGDNTRIKVDTGPVPALTYYAPREKGTDEFSILIATHGNLLLKKKFQFTVR